MVDAIKLNVNPPTGQKSWYAGNKNPRKSKRCRVSVGLSNPEKLPLAPSLWACLRLWSNQLRTAVAVSTLPFHLYAPCEIDSTGDRDGLSLLDAKCATD